MAKPPIADRLAAGERLAGSHHWTVPALARALGVSTAALRQRIERGTLAATKHGRDWLVAPDEAARVLAARHTTTTKGDTRAS